ncbi:DNA-3-methyladenine glycosylase [Candidatus Cyanaurora vandensis]|uniref:DNA-3-methyladenine glycosylase family protein n=1 Tax=Candidatus Cyanaurora vandensis TaxID=2714958 RepID=UPI00257D8D2C|nr:DNA-3-methyladenine glycosylase [Candidatus Cyanaurora vandensis]
MSLNLVTATIFLKQSDPVLAAWLERVGPCQWVLTPTEGDLFSVMVRSILFQQLSGKAAATIHRRFLALYNDSPTAAQVLATPEEMLRGAGISAAKTRYIKDLAHHVLDGLPTLDQLAELEDEGIIQTLTPVKGVGRWTVQMLLFQLQRPDVWPVDDLGIRAGLKKVYALPDLPTPRAAQQLGQPWQPYRSVAAWYLWRITEMKEI